MKIVNLTPHAINLNDGTVFPPSGDVARVEARYLVIDNGETPLIFHQHYGRISGLPKTMDDRRFIVSAIVLAAAKSQCRGDCMAPATGHPDTRRNDKGQIVSVPGLVV